MYRSMTRILRGLYLIFRGHAWVYVDFLSLIIKISSILIWIFLMVSTHLMGNWSNPDIYFSLLTWPPWISSAPNNGGYNYLPGAEARGALGTVPIGLCATLIYSPSNICLIFSGSSSNLILSPSALPYPTPSIPMIHPPPTLLEWM